MTILSLWDNRKAVAHKLAKTEPSPSRTLLIRLLKMKKPDLLLAVADNYFNSHYGVRPMGTTIEIPKELMPKGDHFFQFLTDELKRSIQP